jgi:hypothetical protein
MTKNADYCCHYNPTDNKVAKTVRAKRGMTRRSLWYGWLLASLTSLRRRNSTAKTLTPTRPLVGHNIHLSKSLRQIVQVSAEVPVNITNATLLYQIVEPGAYITPGCGLHQQLERGPHAASNARNRTSDV